MAKPNRKTQDAFYDVFADMDPDEQKIAMRVLEQTHRIALRSAKGKPVEQEAPTLELREPAVQS